MAKLYNTFEFVGNLFIPKEERFLEVNEYDSGWVGHRLNFAVQETKTNSIFVKMDGGYSKSKTNIVKTFSKGTENEKGSSLEIPWDERLKEETVDMVADFRKVIVDFTTDFKSKEEAAKLRYEKRTIEYKDELTEEDKGKLKEIKTKLKELDKDRHEFIHPYDAIKFLSENLGKYSKYKFLLKGQFEYSESKGRFYRNCKPDYIEIVPEDTPAKTKAQYDIFFTKDSLDDTDLDKDKKAFINGYVLSRDSKAKKDVFFPSQFVINASKLDFENELHMKRLNLLKRMFEVEDGVYHLAWEVNLFRGANEVEFTIENLTDEQREFVELGISKLEDFKPKGGILGQNTEENRLVKPLLQKFDDTNNFTGGAKLTTYDEDDLQYVAVAPQPKKEVEVTPDTEPEDVKLDDLDKLFE